MEQATQPATPTAPSETRTPVPPGATVQQAHALASRIIGHLSTWPRAIELHRELTGEYSVHVFWSHDVSGVSALAAWADAAWDLVPSETGTGIWAETRTHVDDVAVWAYTLLSRDEADQARSMILPPAPQPAAPAPDPSGSSTHAVPPAPPVDEDQAAADTVTVVPSPTAVPLGSSILAHVAAVSPQAAPGADVL
ncbi:hypothetical protein ACW4TU_18695 [Streptomyces sp. QTS52]